MRSTISILTALSAALLSAAPGFPAASAVPPAPGMVRDGPVAARLVAEQTGIEPGTPFTIALVLTPDTDWHVYWKYPGDSGLPTTVTWDLPAGFRVGPVRWPVPERFVSQDLVTFGYSGRVLLLVDVTPPAHLPTGQSVLLRVHANWLACRVACTPGRADLALSLRVRAGSPVRDTSWAAAFDETRARLPSAPKTVSFSATGDDHSVTLVASAAAFPPGADVSFYPAADGIKISARQGLSRSADSLRLTLTRDPQGRRADRLSGLLVTAGAGAPPAMDVDVAVTPSQASGGLLAAILAALIGGLILNLMPCVLPVISLKALSLLRQGGGHGLRQGLLFTLGVLVSFWIIAAILEGFRAGGRLLGWGFQFQDPAVVIVTAVLFFLIGLNLFGVFEVGSTFGSLVGKLGRGGGSNATSGGGANAFVTGVFAAAVATPCTAPFMAAAVGYALSHSLAASFAVFTALGVGMAAPSLAVAAVPGLAARLPKPGPWMETFRQVMAFPMMAAAVWMISVLASVSGADGAVMLLAAMLVAGLGAWIWGRWGTLSRSTGARVGAGVLAALLVVGSTAVAARVIPRETPAAAAQTASASTGAWMPWSAARVAELRGTGTPVFVDFTARWCLTCVVNERVALSSGAVRARFAEAGIATLRADWTDTNADISRALADFGRAGVPLYVYYPRGGKDPVVLPEILTPGIVVSALSAD